MTGWFARDRGGDYCDVGERESRCDLWFIGDAEIGCLSPESSVGSGEESHR